MKILNFAVVVAICVLMVGFVSATGERGTATVSSGPSVVDNKGYESGAVKSVQDRIAPFPGRIRYFAFCANLNVHPPLCCVAWSLRGAGCAAIDTRCIPWALPPGGTLVFRCPTVGPIVNGTIVIPWPASTS